LGVSTDGQVLRIRTPSYQEVCGQDPSSEADVSCGSKGLVVINPSLFSAADIATISRGGPDAEALESAALRQIGTSVDSDTLPFIPLSALGGSIGCPQFCPGGGGGLSPFVSVVLTASGAASNDLEISPTLLASVGGYFNTRAPNTARSAVVAAATIGGSSAGITYTVACTGAQWEDTPSIDVCLNVTNPDSRRCPWGVADLCRPCPDHAVCPSGMRAWVEPGYWSSGERSVVVVPCAYPATRCIGHSSATTAAACSPGYSGYRCSTCAPLFYPSTDGFGGCQACPPNLQLVDVARPILLFLGVLTGIGIGMGAIVLLVSRRRGGTFHGGLQRTLQFVLSAVVVLQLVIQVGRAAQPGLPMLLHHFDSILLLLQLEGISLHPNCIKASPFRQEVTEMALGLSLMAALGLLFLNYRHLCSCTGCGVGGVAARRPISRSAAADALTKQPHGVRLAATHTQQQPARVSAVCSAARCFRRWSKTFVLATPFLRRAVFTLLTLLYATVANTALSSLPCETQSLRVADYLQLSMDGTTLLAQLGIGLNAVALTCLDANCERRNPWYDRTVSVSVLTSNPAFVCYESTHFAVAVLAWTCLVVYTMAYPIFSFLLLRRRILQIMERGPLRKQYELAASSDPMRRQAWAQAGSNACARCLRRLCVRVCCLGSRFLPAIAATTPPGVRACCTAFCSAVKPLDTEGAVALGDTVAATEAFAQMVTSLAACAMMPLPTHGARVHDNVVALSGDRQKLALLASAAPAVGPSNAKSGDFAPTSSLGASLNYARRKSGLVLARNLDTSAAASRRPPAVPQAQQAVPRKLLTSAAVSCSPIASRNPMLAEMHHTRTVQSSAYGTLPTTKLDGTTSEVSAGVRRATRAVTANALIDGNPSITRDGSLAHFTASDYRASRYWLRQEDMVVLFALGVLAAFWPRTSDPVSSAGLLVLTVGAICIEASVLIAQKPFTPESQWMFPVRLTALLLACVSALLNYANAINPLPAATEVADSSATDPTYMDTTERPPIVTALSNFAFACSMLLAAVLFIAFLSSLWQGARKEEVDTQYAAMAKRAEADRLRAHRDDIAIVCTPTQPVSGNAEALVRDRRGSSGSSDGVTRVSFGAQSTRSGRMGRRIVQPQHPSTIRRAQPPQPVATSPGLPGSPELVE